MLVIYNGHDETKRYTLDLEFFIETDSSVIHAKIVESASEGRYNANLKNKKFS